MTQPALAQEIFAQPLPEFFPQRLRHSCSGKHIQFRLPAAVRERMQVPEDISASQWAEKYRRVTAIDAYPGRWRNDLVPHTVKPMDFISAPYVRQLSLCLPERGGKTNVILNGAMRQIDRGVDSGNVFWLMPTENEAKKALGERIIPALKESPRTARLLTRYADDTTRNMVRFKHGPRLFPAWSNSAASVSSFFGRLNIADEIDKFDTNTVGRETDILTLFYKRGRDRDDSKFLFASTPAQGYIYKLTMGSQQVWEFKPRCPHCDTLIEMDEEHFVIHAGAGAKDIAHGKHAITYACNACGVEWDEVARKRAYYLGEWVAIIGADVKEPETVGMHMSAFPLPNIPMREIAEKIVKAKNGGVLEKRALYNGYKVIDYEEEKISRKEDDILRLVDEHMPRGVVPRDTSTFILKVDTQAIGFKYQVLAFQYGPHLTCHLVDHGELETFEALKEKGLERHRDADGKEYAFHGAIIDSGGGTNPQRPKHSRTKEVYEFCRANPLFKPVKGRRDQAQPWSVTRLDHFPTRDGKKIPIPGGLNLYTINVTLYKNQLSQKLSINPGDPGCITLHAEVTAKYAAQLCAEYQDERGYWECADGKANHYWDCWVYGLALADIIGIARKRKPVIRSEPLTVKPRPGSFVKGWRK